MSDKRFAFIAVPAMVACCVGLPLLLGWLMSVGLFAWLADSAFVVIVVVVIAAAVVYVLHRDRRKQRQSPRGTTGAGRSEPRSGRRATVSAASAPPISNQVTPNGASFVRAMYPAGKRRCENPW